MWKTNSLCGNDMSLLVFVKACHPFDGHVIRFRGPGRKDNVLWISTNQVGNVLIYVHENRKCGEWACRDEPLSRLPLPSPLPSHTRVFDYVDFHTDPSSKEA